MYRRLHALSLSIKLLNAEVYEVDSLLIIFAMNLHPPRYTFFSMCINGVQKKDEFIKKLA